jgi:hypothetical protein
VRLDRAKVLTAATCLTNAAEGRDFMMHARNRGTGARQAKRACERLESDLGGNLRWSKSRPTLISRSAIFHAHFESPPACRPTSGFFASALEIAK